jgi:hypothetical protein
VIAWICSSAALIWVVSCPGFNVVEFSAVIRFDNALKALEVPAGATVNESPRPVCR